MKLILMRGLPGSGKSTRAKALAVEYNAVICSADEYFVKMKKDFNFLTLKKAHEWCQCYARIALMEERNVIIDNTDLTMGDITPYLELAKEYDATICVARSNTAWANDTKKCAESTIHGVPVSTIDKMKMKMDAHTDMMKTYEWEVL